MSRNKLPTVGDGVGGNLTSLSRQMLCLVVQVITGDSNLGKRNPITGRSTTEICPKCQEEVETPDQHVGQCPVFHNLRVQHLQDHETMAKKGLTEEKVNQLAQYLKWVGRLMEFS